MSGRIDAREVRTRSLLERYAGAWARGDLAEAAACYHDDFTLHWFGRNSLAGAHTGRQAALGALAEFRRRTNRHFPKIVAVAAGVEHGFIIAREELGPEDARAEVERVLVFAVREDLLVECWVYDADQRQIDRLIDGTPCAF